METVSTEELERMKNSGEDFALVDVLGADHFQEEHIPGAVNIPLDRIGEEAMARFSEDDTLVVYCGSESCQASPKAAEKLEKLGFRNVIDYEGGLKAWKETGNQLASV